MGITWYDGKQTPNDESGSYIILTNKGNIAEAEWRNNHWYPYRWSSQYEPHEVKAWCRLDDVKETYTPSNVRYSHQTVLCVKFEKDGMDNSIIYDVYDVQGTGQTCKLYGHLFSYMKFKAICEQDSQLKKWFYDYHDKPMDHVGKARLFAINGETGETVRTYNLQDVYPANYKSYVRYNGNEGEFLGVEFNCRFPHDMITESV